MIRHANPLAAVVIGLLAAGGCFLEGKSALAQEKPKAFASLSKEETNRLKNGVYIQGPAISMMGKDGKTFGRVLVVPSVVVDLHKKKPVAVMRVLLEIVQRDDAKSARAAAACAVALEDSPIMATLYLDQSLNSFEQIRPTVLATVRDLLAKTETRAQRSAK